MGHVGGFATLRPGDDQLGMLLANRPANGADGDLASHVIAHQFKAKQDVALPWADLAGCQQFGKGRDVYLARREQARFALVLRPTRGSVLDLETWRVG
jgi:hypothetical protein